MTKYNIPRVLISACGSGSGKTTVVCGILKALKNRGVNVSSCKCGPDYIDPMFHKKVIGVESKNLDKFFCDDKLLKQLFIKQAKNSDFTIVEGVMGFYDGVSMENIFASSYDIAKSLDIPVILVINAKGIAFTLISLIKGIIAFKKDNNVKGIILNNISKAIFEKFKTIIENEIGIEVLGYLPYDKDYQIESRHLGLLQPEDIEDINFKIEKLGEVSENCFNIDKIIDIGKNAESITYFEYTKKLPALNKVKIGVAKDSAFCFYYKDNLEILQELGCEIVYFSPLQDTNLLYDISGVILGGGYPELYAEKLSQNKLFINDLKNKIENGLPCLAECGGFMYLHKTMEDKNKNKFEMVGIIDGSAIYCGKLIRFGYNVLTAQKDNFILKKGEKIKSHEFHYWDSTNNGDYFSAEKINGNNWNCIHSIYNTICGFPHIFYYSNPKFAKKFIEKCIDFKLGR